MVNNIGQLLSAGCIFLAALTGSAFAQQNNPNQHQALWKFEKSITELNGMVGCNIMPIETKPNSMDEMNVMIVQYLRQMTDCLLTHAGSKQEVSELKQRAAAYEAIIVTLNKSIGCDHIQAPNLSSMNKQVLASNINQYHEAVTQCVLTTKISPLVKRNAQTANLLSANELVARASDIEALELNARDWKKWKQMLMDKLGKGKHQEESEEDDCEESDLEARDWKKWKQMLMDKLGKGEHENESEEDDCEESDLEARDWKKWKQMLMDKLGKGQHEEESEEDDCEESDLEARDWKKWKQMLMDKLGKGQHEEESEEDDCEESDLEARDWKKWKQMLMDKLGKGEHEESREDDCEESNLETRDWKKWKQMLMDKLGKGQHEEESEEDDCEESYLETRDWKKWKKIFMDMMNKNGNDDEEEDDCEEDQVEEPCDNELEKRQHVSSTHTSAASTHSLTNQPSTLKIIYNTVPPHSTVSYIKPDHTSIHSSSTHITVTSTTATLYHSTLTHIVSVHPSSSHTSLPHTTVLPTPRATSISK